MASLPREHSSLYFDRLVRTQKSESLLSLIMASYYAHKNETDDIKGDIAKRLVYGYNLFRDNVGQASGAGSYEGTASQFESQYTIGHEMAIWKDSDLNLTDLAKRVAKNEISIKEYLDIIFLNYIQPISGKMVHPLYLILLFLKSNNSVSIDKNDIPRALDCECDQGSINAITNFLKDTNFFELKGNSLCFNEGFDMDAVIELCNKKYMGNDGYTKAKQELVDSNEYEKYISTNSNYLEKLYSKSEKYDYEDLDFDELVGKLKESITVYDKVVGIHIFGIKYGPCIRKNHYNVKDIIRKSGIGDSFYAELNKGISLSNYVYPKCEGNADEFYRKDGSNTGDNSSKIDVMSHNLFGIHINNLNDAISDSNPHICIGWSGMGDLSGFSKEQIFGKYTEVYTDARPRNRSQNVGQIDRFINEAKVGDFVLYINNKLIHIGRITSDHFYDNKSYPEQNPDYVNIRKVEWLKKNVNRDIFSKTMSKSMATSMSFFRLNDYRSVISDILNDNYVSDDEENIDDITTVDYNFDNKSGANLVVYGTPGCGKSYYVQHTLLMKGGYGFDENGNCLDAIRTTFYQDYTNTDFVGQIMPVVNPDKSVTYEFNPGPFTLALNMAIQNPDKPIALVIEELNRGNAASIFGDIFQLLDRKDGTSVYNITNVNIQKYLGEQNPTLKFDNIKLPSNLSIFATMNTSDQNVFTLDTAFKRRWKFIKIKNTFTNSHEFKDYFIPGMDMAWEEFCNSINDFIVNSDEFINSEDKQLGIYFVDKDSLRVHNADASTEQNRKDFAFKIFEYLWDDVAKYDRKKWFGDAKTLDDLIDNYVEKGEGDLEGIEVFSKGIFEKK